MCTVCLTVSGVSFEPSTLYCNLLDYGYFQPTSYGSQFYAFSTIPPATKQPSITTSRCSMTCPEANGQIYVSLYGISNIFLSSQHRVSRLQDNQTFYMCYRMRHYTPYLNIESVSTLENCIDLCYASASCSSVVFDQTEITCYLSSNDNPPTYKASRFASTHSRLIGIEDEIDG
ncbi:hypothetical protein N7457_005216 [Penicillium paradoxum]|uniref:uncharacterized protein n=1 Tax=Penicillium paradoxum TaxID=176176 RepID=UPI002547C1EE|nr:uncharacterized protein N7457_005216 [Penicillium paradoxum]KAJ5780056.1 hypothetical protein N7457_005216 [Penicillium paradoxum]